MKTTRVILALALLAHLSVAAAAPAHAAPPPPTPAAAQAQKTHVVDTVTDSAGNPLRGKITFVLTQKSATSPDGLVVASPTVSATLDSAGKFHVYLYPSASLSPVSYYQVYVTSGAGSQTLIGVYNIPASSSLVTLAPYKVTDAALAAQYTFADRPSVLALTNAVAGATFQSLLSGTTAGRVLKRGGSGLLDSAVNETESAVTVGKGLTVTGGPITGNASGLSNLPGTPSGPAYTSLSGDASTWAKYQADGAGVGTFDVYRNAESVMQLDAAGNANFAQGLARGGAPVALEQDITLRRVGVPEVKLESTAAYDFASVAMYSPAAGLEVYGRRATKHPTFDAGHIRRWTAPGAGALDDYASAPLFDESGSGLDSTNPAGGVSPKGTRLVFYARYNTGTSAFTDIRIRRSTDGTTWADVGAMPLVAGAADFSPYGPMVSVPRPASAAGYRLLQSAYDITTGKAWLAYSDNDGLAWSLGATIVTDLTSLPTEGSLCYLSGSGSAASLLYVTRQEGAGLRQLKSADSGATWTDQGVLAFSTGGGSGGDVSPWLVNMGDGRVTLVWAARSTHHLKAITASAAGVLANASAWGAAARSIYRSTMQDRGVSGAQGHFGYPSVARVGAGAGKEGLVVVFSDMSAGSTNTGNTQVVDVDLYQMPLFPAPAVTVTSTATQSIASGASDPLVWNKVLVDTDAMFVSSDTVRVRTGGTCLVSAGVLLSRPAGLGGVARLQVVLNGLKELPGSHAQNFNDAALILGSPKVALAYNTTFPCRAGDELKLYLAQTSDDATSRATSIHEWYSPVFNVTVVR